MSEARIERTEQARDVIVLRGKNDRIRVLLPAVNGGNAPAGAPSRDSVHALLDTDRVRREAADECARQLLHAVRERHEQGPAGAARSDPLGRGPARGAPHGEDDAALSPLHFEKPRHGRRQREVVRVRRVDARDQRLRDTFERLLAEPAADERAEALVAVATAWQSEVERHAELARPGEEIRREEWAQSRRRQQLKAVRQRMQTSAKYHEGPAEAVVGPEQPILDAEATAQLEGPRFLGEKRIGAAFDEESAVTLGSDRAAQPIGGVVDGEVDGAAALARSLDDAVSGCESGDAAADHDHLHERAGPILTRSASISMKRGWSLAAAAR